LAPRYQSGFVIVLLAAWPLEDLAFGAGVRWPGQRAVASAARSWQKSLPRMAA
jgi:hypothetical protein